MPAREPVRALDALWDDVVAWLREAAVTDDGSGGLTRGGVDVDAVHATMARLVTDATSLGLVDVTSWSPQVIGDLAQRLAERDPGAAMRQWSPLVAFLAYLGTSGRWSGTPEQLDAATQAASDAEAVFTDHALRALPIVGQLHALLAWVGPRRLVTGTQSIRQGDLPDAARCVGVDLATVRVTSMAQVAHLPEVWSALIGGGALDVGVTVARPSDLGQAWLAEAPTVARRARLQALLVYLTVVLARPNIATWFAPPGVMFAPLLRSAALGTPITAAALEEALAAGSPTPSDSAQTPPGMDGLMFARGPLQGLVDQLTRDGVLQRSPGADASWTVAPGLQRLVHLAPEMLETPTLLESSTPRPS